MIYFNIYSIYKLWFNIIFILLVQRNGNYPLISSYEGKFVNVFCLETSQNHKTLNLELTQNLNVEHENDYIIGSNDEEEDIYETELAYLHGILDKVFKFLYNTLHFNLLLILNHI